MFIYLCEKCFRIKDLFMKVKTYCYIRNKLILCIFECFGIKLLKNNNNNHNNKQQQQTFHVKINVS